MGADPELAWTRALIHQTAHLSFAMELTAPLTIDCCIVDCVVVDAATA